MSQEEEDYTGEEEKEPINEKLLEKEYRMSKYYRNEKEEEEKCAEFANGILNLIDKEVINLDVLLKKENFKKITERIKSIKNIITNNKTIQEAIKNPKQYPDYTVGLCRIIFSLLSLDSDSESLFYKLNILSTLITTPPKKSETK